MRSYILASLGFHLVILLTGNWLAAHVARETPTFDTISVALATLPVPEPEPEPEPIPPAPAELETEPPELELEAAPPTPQEPAPDLVPPDPSLPEAPPEPKPEPPVEETPGPEELPEPAAVAPEPVAEPPVEETVQTELPERAGEERVSEDTAVDMAMPEGVPDYYAALVKRKISRRWEPSKAASRGRRVECVVAFYVGPAGDILNPSISRSSGLSVFDRAALRAVISSNPLPQPPPRFPAGFPIEFIFVYTP